VTEQLSCTKIDNFVGVGSSNMNLQPNKIYYRVDDEGGVYTIRRFMQVHNDETGEPVPDELEQIGGVITCLTEQEVGEYFMHIGEHNHPVH